MTTDTSHEPIILYGHEACPMMPPVWGMLKQCKVNFEYVNIRTDHEARQRVREINHGNESVPTLVFPDGTTLTEPPASELRKKLIQEGYSVSLLAMVWGYSFQILMATIILQIGRAHV